MNLPCLSVYSDGRVIRKHVGPLMVAVTLCLFAMMMAKGCVKRPSLEPTPGVSAVTLVNDQRERLVLVVP